MIAEVRSLSAHRLFVPLVAMVFLVALLLPAKVAQAHGCGASVVGNAANWTTSTSSCGVFGSPGVRVTYQWSVLSGTNQNACVQALAFTRDGVKTWVGLGCGGHRPLQRRG